MSSYDDILGTIKDHLAGRGIDAEDVIPSAAMGDDLDFDSLDTAELTLAIEEKFAIEVADADLDGVRTIGDIVEVVQAKTASLL